MINKKESVYLFAGDILVFVLSLWLMLLLRYQELPSKDIILLHAGPFSFLFIAWSLVFFISGLYERRSLAIRREMFADIFKVQVANSIIAIIFFYLVPDFGITPKTNLFIYLIVSFILIVLWRYYIAPLIGIRKKTKALIIGSRNEIIEIKDAINNNSWYNLNLISSIDLEHIENLDFKRDISDLVYSENISVIIADLDNKNIKPILPRLYNLMFAGVSFMNANNVYEEVFGKIPISMIEHEWFLENITTAPHTLYDFLKRLMDIFISSILGIFSLLVYPFVILAIKIEDGGSIFIKQKRTGKGGKEITIYKFRSMTEGDSVRWANHGSRITKVGAILRKTSIDELPQLFNVLKGDLSLVGPRPELPELVKVYSESIPYYNIRHLHKPGMSGWAQIYHINPPHHITDVESTKEKLCYDLFYIKHHSFMLDIKIALKTVNILISRIFGAKV